MPRGRDAYEQARLQGRLWTPASVRPLLGVWYDFSNLESLTLVGSAVGQVNDLSGNNRHMVQVTAGNRPIWVAGGWDGVRPCIQTVDAGDHLVVNSAYVPTDFTIFCTIERFAQTSDATTVPRVVMATLTGNADPVSYKDRYLYVPRASTPTFTVDTLVAAGNVITAIRCSTVTPFTEDKRIVATGIYPSSDYTGTRVAMDGAAGSTITVDADSSATINRLYLMGMASTAARTFLGKMGEFVLVNGSVLGSLLQTFEGYLAWKWGTQASLVVSHPFRNRPPVIGD